MSYLKSNISSRKIDKELYKTELQKSIEDELNGIELDEDKLDVIHKYKVNCYDFYKNINNYNKETYYSYFKEFYTIFLSDEYCDMIELRYSLRTKYNLDNSCILKQEILIVYYIACSIILKKQFSVRGIDPLRTSAKLEGTLESYFNDVVFLEKFLIRIKCIKNGWKPDSIEKMLNRYYKAEISVPIEKINQLYICFSLILNNFRLNNKPLLKGRPNLDPIVKNILNRYTIKKKSSKIKNMIIRVKKVDNLFTTNEINVLKNIVETSTESYEMKEALKHKLTILMENQ